MNIETLITEVSEAIRLANKIFKLGHRWDLDGLEDIEALEELKIFYEHLKMVSNAQSLNKTEKDQLLKMAEQIKTITHEINFTAGELQYEGVSLRTEDDEFTEYCNQPEENLKADTIEKTINSPTKSFSPRL